jgi:hypothetical protein
MQELELTWGRFGTVFWLCFWRMVVMCSVGGIATTYLLHRMLMVMIGNPGPPGIGAIVLILLSVLALRMTLLKKYRGFRIALISTSGRDSPLMNCIPNLKSDELVESQGNEVAGSDFR